MPVNDSKTGTCTANDPIAWILFFALNSVVIIIIIIIIINILISINPKGNTCPVICICTSLTPKQVLLVQKLHNISFLTFWRRNFF